LAQISNLSESLEDYLEIILQLDQEKGEARVKDIAERKGVRMASVTGAMKRLAKEKLIDYRRREMVTLTPEGSELAHRVLQRHEFITRFLGDILGVSAEVAERDACSIEHIISLETLDRLAAFVEFLKSCPQAGGNIVELFNNCYGQVLKQESGEGTQGMACRNQSCLSNFPDSSVRFFSSRAGRVALSDMKPGDRGRVVSVRAATSIRQRLIDMGLLPGVELEMLRVAPLGDPIEIKLKGYNLSLRKIEASTIAVEVI
jgi:DtxR family transcriptional regulator, Mn-dependent transcriptional regulator